MPDNFHPGGKHGSLFDRAVSGSHVRLMLRLDKGFTGKGTSVAVRIIVADKGSGARRPPPQTNRARVRGLLEPIPEDPDRKSKRPNPSPNSASRRPPPAGKKTTQNRNHKTAPIKITITKTIPQ